MPYFDAITGQLVNPGSAASFLIFAAIVAVGLFVWRKVDNASFNATKAKLEAELQEIKARASKSGPEFVASLQADVDAAKAKLEAFLKK